MRSVITFFACLILSASAFAGTDQSPKKMTADEFEASLKYQKGEVLLPNKVAKLTIPDNFRYLSPEDAERVLVDAWGNPAGGETQGMIFPAAVSPLSDDGWGVIITYEEDGHVSDDDADSIKYDDLLKQMQMDVAERNEARRKEGYEPVNLIGWAARPFYEKESHKLYWAKELQFGEEKGHTLNYNIRVLGRKGVLVLNAVAGMNQLPAVEKDMKQVLAFTEFTSGNRYSDFNSSTDKVAAYGIGALVAGGIAAKTGLLAKLVGVLLAAKKVIFVGIVAAGGFIVSIFRKKKKDGEEV